MYMYSTGIGNSEHAHVRMRSCELMDGWITGYVYGCNLLEEMGYGKLYCIHTDVRIYTMSCMHNNTLLINNCSTCMLKSVCMLTS